MTAAVAVIATLAVLAAVLFILGVAGGYCLSKYHHKLPCCMTLRSSELDEVLVTPFDTKQIQTKTAADGKQRIAISASTTQSVESNGAVFSTGIAAHNFGRTASIELGDIYRTASAISVFLEEADARPFINRLMSMPVMNSDGLANRPVIDACTINPNIEVSMDEIDLAEQIGKGGFGAVYKGTWRGAPVAVKYAVCNVQDVDSIEGAIREVVLSKKMSHPNVVQTYAWTVLDGSTSAAAKQGPDSQRGLLQRALQGANSQDDLSVTPRGGSTPIAREPSEGPPRRRNRRSSMGPELLTGHAPRHRRSSLGPGQMEYSGSVMRELFSHGCSSFEQNRPSQAGPGVRRSASTTMGPPRGRLLRERSRLSVLTDAGSSEASPKGNGSSWEQELLQLQIASSALINPLGNTESAPIADPRIIAEVTHHVEQARTDSPTDTSSKIASPSGSENRSRRGSLDLQEPAGDAGQNSAGAPHSSSGNVAGDVTRGYRSAASPFFAAAQRFLSLAAPAAERPLRAPPPPLLTAFAIPSVEEDSGSPVFAGLALQRQTEAVEITALQSSSSSLNSSPTLPYHPLTIPLSPQTTAKGFVTADSFKHEPGHTLLDCTDPTPKNSLDLDDPNLKSRLAQLLPHFPLLPSKPVKRNLSNQMGSLESLSEVPDGDDNGSGLRANQQLSPPGPSSGKRDSSDEGTSEAKTTRSQAAPTAARTRLRLSETGSVCERQGSQTGSFGVSGSHYASMTAVGSNGDSSTSGASRTTSRVQSQETRRGGTLGLRRELSSRNVSEYELDRVHVETSAASFTSFNSEEGFGSPAAHRNKDRPNVFDMDDNDLKGQDTVIVVVMEFCDLGSLMRAVNKKAFKPHGKWSYHTTYRALLRTAQEIAKGMDYIHSFGIIHGDLKLGNVLLKTHRVDRRGYVAKVSDFGLSRPLQESEEDVPAGNHVGTIMYTAPETFRDCRLTKPGDVYAFGIMSKFSWMPIGLALQHWMIDNTWLHGHCA
ncbi:TPA: hypothetical protein ACH3X1_014017 [Trebouxia sp. C0004]